MPGSITTDIVGGRGAPPATTGFGAGDGDSRGASRRASITGLLVLLAAVERCRYLSGDKSLELVLLRADVRARRAPAGRNLGAGLHRRAGVAAPTGTGQTDGRGYQRVFLAFSGCHLDLPDGAIFLLGVMN